MRHLSLTRIIGLIALGSQAILRAKAADPVSLPTCQTPPTPADGTTPAFTNCGNSDNSAAIGETYCINSGATILYQSTSNACKTIDGTDGLIKIFTGSSTFSEANLASATDNIIIYQYSNTESKWVQKDVKYYYSGSSTKKLLKLKSETTKQYDVVSAATDNGYYLLTSTNSNVSTNTLISVTTGTTKEITPADGKYYLDQDNYDSTDRVYKNIIECKGTTVTCGNPASLTAGVYVNAGTAGTNTSDGVIICTSANSSITCAAGGADDSYYKNAGSDQGTKPYIECNTTEKCKAKAPADNGTYYYLDKSTETGSGSSKIMTGYLLCKKDATTNTCTPTSKPSTDGEVVILLNSAVSGALENALIKCTNNKCEAMDEVSAGYYVNDDANNKILIECKNSGCAPATNPSTEAPYIDAGVTSNTNIIKCTGTNNSITCSSTKQDAAGVYVNAGTAGTVIICSGSPVTCKASTAITDANTKEYYANGGSDSATNAYIECSSSECKSKPVTATSYYLDKGTADANGKMSGYLLCKDDKTCAQTPSPTDTKVVILLNSAVESGLPNALIQCTGGECKAINGVANKYYLNGDDANKILIECSSKCGKASTTSIVAAYIDAGVTSNDKTTNIITCTSDTACSSTTKTTGYYLDASDSTKKNIITCGTSECKSEEKTKANGNYLNAIDAGKTVIACVKDGICEAKSIQGYYVNSGTDKTDNPLLQCSGENCQSIALPTGDNVPAIPVYLNANFKSTSNLNGDATNHLIVCSSSKKTCGIKGAKENDIYINANFVASTNVKQIIKCTQSGCAEDAAYGEGVDGKIYYVNAGHESEDALNDTLIECTTATTACTIKTTPPQAGDIYVNALDNQLIQCTEAGCAGKTTKANNDSNEFYLNASDPLKGDLIRCSLTKDESGNTVKKCAAWEAKDKAVYINAFNTTEVIQCFSASGCHSNPSNATATSPEYYVNGDDINLPPNTPEERKRGTLAQQPLIGDLIECKVNGASGIKCSVAKGNDGDIYINSNYCNEENADNNQLIACDAVNGCIATPVSSAAGVDITKLPQYYVNSGNKSTTKLEQALIKCAATDAECEIISAEVNDVYVNSNKNQKQKPLIKCSKNNCAVAASGATVESGEFYLNAGKVDKTPLNYDIISCTEKEVADDSEVSCKCLSSTEVNVETGVAVYINSNYAESGDANQLIQCSSENGCVGVKSESASKDMEYYVNAESKDTLSNAIIYCSNKRCEKQTPDSVPVYYVGKDSKNDVDGLIECKEVDGVSKCTMKSAFSSQGYYLNSGNNKATNQTIFCDSYDGCSTLNVSLGYYVNAGNSEKQIIKCEKEGFECVEEKSPTCPEIKDATPGNYCYDNGQLKFFISNNSTAITASKSDNTYTFATIPSNGFPGIRSETGALFKVSYYYINRYYQSGVVMIDKNGKLVESLSGDQSDVKIYECNDNNKSCTEKAGCTSNTYMFDSENSRAIFCDDGKMEYVNFNGYVVDGNRAIQGNKHPYLIHCTNNGLKCTSLKPKISTYYENNGYDALTNSLIQCENSNCRTVTAEVGYYIGHGDDGNSGIIKCVSATSCSYLQVKSKVKYVNAGSDKNTNALIECNKDNGCSLTKAKIGYYLTHTSSLLIYCSSTTSCSEITPTVNYFDNADSSESNPTIINCIQNSNVVTCGTEASNNGFYLSGATNILIRCKNGSNCKSIAVKNGLFRGALKNLNANSNNNARTFNEDELEEDGTKVTVRDNNDDAYGIIRCVEGKCEALTPNQLAAIPMCEFNNNKCYITLDYAMTKSATTSISAGNICTNNDRSVFYFATDTVVVKPNVISGVPATYVYTTTNSNCLEVNDSYSDNYFTVGSNIYTISHGSVLQFYETGYYFINVEKNTLVKGNKIESYNNENVKLYRCNGSMCNIVNKPESDTYYADVNKRILKYDVSNDVYSFAYDKDIICKFANNKCTPNADMKSQEFCITYKGEIVLATTDIKNRETGECYRASSMNSEIYGYSRYLYTMNQFSAQIVDNTGYYIVSINSNSTVVSKDIKNKRGNLVVYGCILSSCKVYEPDESTYYYDGQAKTILKYKNNVWKYPSKSGYAYVSTEPKKGTIYKFVKNDDEIKLESVAKSGYYYTIDNEMYECDESNECNPIEETNYYFTNDGEIYYCVHDSEELEETECTRKPCIVGQYYSINDSYYRCDMTSTLTPVVSRYCSFSDKVIMNFPLALTEKLPFKVEEATENIRINNNSTAVISYSPSRNILDTISAVYTNCTYNVEETKATFDLLCVKNYVTVDEETDDIKICSLEQLGYVDCIEDDENADKCNVSGAFIIKPSILVAALVLFFTTLYHLY